MGIAIRLRDITFRYDGAKENVLEHVDLDIAYGELVLLSGLSGEGKSTLLSIINGVIPFVNGGKCTGTVEIDGRDVTGQKISARAARVGTVLQNADEQIIYDFVADEIAFGCENCQLPPAEIEERIARCTRLLELDPAARTRTLSGGQKQRLITASTLAMGQKVIVLDEPLANLDTGGAHILLGALRTLADRDYAVLLVEHRLDVVRQYVDRVLWIADKTLHTDSTTHRMEQGMQAVPATHKGTCGETLLSARGLTFCAGGRTILNGVDLDIHAEERLVLLGENGCGKTTLLRTLAKLNKPSGGTLRQTLTKRDKANSKWFAQVGYVYQNPTYQLFMPTLRSEIAYRATSPKKAEEMIRAFGLEGLEERHPQSLSEGQKRRASIAAICAGEPRVLFLDEPTVGQDFANLCKIVAAINQMNRDRQTAVVTITHDKRCAQALADRVVILQEGQIRQEGDCRLATDYLNRS